MKSCSKHPEVLTSKKHPCKFCGNDRAKAWKLRNPDRVRTMAREYFLVNRERIAEYQKKRRADASTRQIVLASSLAATYRLKYGVFWECAQLLVQLEKELGVGHGGQFGSKHVGVISGREENGVHRERSEKRSVGNASGPEKQNGQAR